MRHWITPYRLADPQWRAFDADRPDFNGAPAQFANGLLQTTTPMADSIDWRGLFGAPPDAATLQQWFAPVAAAFELDGDGPRFRQDFGLGTNGVAVNEIGGLLIDAPGENTVKNNADHFVKRAQVDALCPACAAMALFTLQLNAPAGGAGHRTGLRGGGPLTTLVLAPAVGTLWHDLRMNERDRPPPCWHKAATSLTRNKTRFEGAFAPAPFQGAGAKRALVGGKNCFSANAGRRQGPGMFTRTCSAPSHGSAPSPICRRSKANWRRRKCIQHTCTGPCPGASGLKQACTGRR